MLLERQHLPSQEVVGVTGTPTCNTTIKCCTPPQYEEQQRSAKDATPGGVDAVPQLASPGSTLPLGAAVTTAATPQLLLPPAVTAASPGLKPSPQPMEVDGTSPGTAPAVQPPAVAQPALAPQQPAWLQGKGQQGAHTNRIMNLIIVVPPSLCSCLIQRWDGACSR